ncbi:MAG: sigma-70 family RNA polymerase sigma factor [Polyangiaceae bacterium]|nr:sigma-70 family RNA polymerase sigma factor [Polyangiaceae bacterium]
MATGVVDYDDLVQIGRVAALRAAERFDPTYDVPFERYAWRYITFEMRKALAAQRGEQTLRTELATVAALELGGGIEDAADVWADTPERAGGELRTELAAMAGAWLCGFAADGRGRGGEDALAAELDRRRASAVVQTVLTELGEEPRRLLVQRWFLGRGHDEIALREGMSKATATRKLAAALRLAAARIAARLGAGAGGA